MTQSAARRSCGARSWSHRLIGVRIVAAAALTPLTLTGCNVTAPSADSNLPMVAVDQQDPDDHVLAAGDPSITVIEYADVECPVCGRFARDVFPTIREEYVDTGKVRWIVRHFPLPQYHPHAELAAEAAECAADQDAFWDYIDHLFNNQSALERTDLIDYAATLGLDADTLTRCLDSGDKADRVQRDVDSGWDLGINGTPGFVIDGQVVIGLIEVDDFRMRLDHLLESASTPAG
jgi:protein-disulfide isomerase